MVHTQGGMWPPQESCYLGGGGAGPGGKQSELCDKRSEPKAVGVWGGCGEGGWMDGWMDGEEAFRGPHPEDTGHEAQTEGP